MKKNLNKGNKFFFFYISRKILLRLTKDAETFQYSGIYFAKYYGRGVGMAAGGKKMKTEGMGAGLAKTRFF